MQPAEPAPLRVAVAADLHYGSRHPEGDLATLELVAHLAEEPPDLLILAGDVGAGEAFERCLALFAGLGCRKALVPGNHDVWVLPDDARGDSLRVYREHLPAACRRQGFHYLDDGPLLLPETGLAVVGSMNWYDYSWSAERLPALAPDDWEERLRTKRFRRGRHNDAIYVRWPHTDASFTDEAVTAFGRHLDEALARVGRAIVVTHHPPLRTLNPPAPAEPGLDDLLWVAFSGNARLEALLAERSASVPFAFCGHTHYAREAEYAGIRGYNVGGNYQFKRLLRLDWPAGTVRALEFGGG